MFGFFGETTLEVLKNSFNIKMTHNVGFLLKIKIGLKNSKKMKNLLLLGSNQRPAG